MSLDDGIWPPGVSREQMMAAVAAVDKETAPVPAVTAPPPADRDIRDQTWALCLSHGEKNTHASRRPEQPAADSGGRSGGFDGPVAAVVCQAHAAQSLLARIDADPALRGLGRASSVLARSLGPSWMLGWLMAAARSDAGGAVGSDTETARLYEIAVATALVALGLEAGTPDDTRATRQATEALENYGSVQEAAGGTAAAERDVTIAALGRALCGDCRRWTPEELESATVPGLLGAARALVRAGHVDRARSVFFVLAPTPPHRPLFKDVCIWNARHRTTPP